MRRIKHKDGREHVELTAEEARQGRLGRPMLYVLIGLLVGTTIALAIAGFVIA